MLSLDNCVAALNSKYHHSTLTSVGRVSALGYEHVRDPGSNPGARRPIFLPRFLNKKKIQQYPSSNIYTRSRTYLHTPALGFRTYHDLSTSTVSIFLNRMKINITEYINNIILILLIILVIPLPTILFE